MAEILSQNEIDDLLSANIGGDDTPDDQETAPAKSETIPVTEGGKRKYFKPQRQRAYRFQNIYKSPVIKKSSMVFNPDPTQKERDEIQIVRTLENYVAHLKHKHHIQEISPQSSKGPVKKNT